MTISEEAEQSTKELEAELKRLRDNKEKIKKIAGG
jgi:cell division protein FtsB